MKDHKENYENNPSFRLLNPTKPESGCASKQILQNIVRQLRLKTKFNQWEDSSATINWFNVIKHKRNVRFIQFDIKDFYPSISEKLLTDSLNWAQDFVNISDNDKNVIFQSRKSFLYYKGQPWEKKTNTDCDVTMGSYDGAEICDL